METAKMKTFKRVRPLREIQAACTERGWKINTEKLDRAESDFVHVSFQVGAMAGFVLFSAFNGETKTGGRIDSNVATHDNEEWFEALLSVFYDLEDQKEVA